MRITKSRHAITIWFGKSKFIGNSKSFAIGFFPNHWRVFGYNSNGAKKRNPKDRCLDVSFWVLGFCFNYTNWEYHR